jgi:hypothetical protein
MMLAFSIYSVQPPESFQTGSERAEGYPMSLPVPSNHLCNVLLAGAEENNLSDHRQRDAERLAERLGLVLLELQAAS